jgi:hypothetical protein
MKKKAVAVAGISIGLIVTGLVGCTTVPPRDVPTSRPVDVLQVPTMRSVLAALANPSAERATNGTFLDFPPEKHGEDSLGRRTRNIRTLPDVAPWASLAASMFVSEIRDSIPCGPSAYQLASDTSTFSYAINQGRVSPLDVAGVRQLTPLGRPGALVPFREPLAFTAEPMTVTTYDLLDDRGCRVAQVFASTHPLNGSRFTSAQLSADYSPVAVHIVTLATYFSFSSTTSVGQK